MTNRFLLEGLRDKAAFNALQALAMGCMVALNIFLFVPLTIYLGNVTEFNSPLAGIFANFVLPFVVLVLIMALVGFILPSRMLQRCLAMQAVLCLLLWIQGNLLVWDYSALDGKAIDWNKAMWRAWVDTPIWLVLLGAALLFTKRMARPLIVAAMAITALQIGSAAIAILQNSAAVFGNGTEQDRSNSSDNIFRFSTRRNVLHIVMDGFQSDMFDEIINEGEPGKRFRDALGGFVLFRDNMGAFPYTHMSVPALLSGQIYKNQETRNEFFARTLDRNTILRAAMKSGFEVDVAAGPALSFYKRSGYTNAYAISSHEHVSASDYTFSQSVRLLDITLFRLVPHLMKKRVYNDQLWLLQPLFSNNGYEHLDFFAHNAFLRQLSTRMAVDRNKPVYKMFHLMLSHQPFVADEQCGYAGEPHNTTRYWVKVQDRCSLKRVMQGLDQMKALGIYDDATIILMGDHGSWIPPRGLTGDMHADSGFSPALPFPITVAMAEPVMAIKPPGATGPLRVSMAPTWIGDVPQTIAGLLDLEVTFGGQSMFDLSEFATRERRHYSYAYDRSEMVADYLASIHEFIVTGHVADGWAWRKGATFPAPAGAGK